MREAVMSTHRGFAGGRRPLYIVRVRAAEADLDDPYAKDREEEEALVSIRGGGHFQPAASSGSVMTAEGEEVVGDWHVTAWPDPSVPEQRVRETDQLQDGVGPGAAKYAVLKVLTYPDHQEIRVREAGRV